MNLTDLRADIVDAINFDMSCLGLAANESADNDNVILVAKSDGTRYKLTIEPLP
jgi:hypothetical protein